MAISALKSGLKTIMVIICGFLGPATGKAAVLPPDAVLNGNTLGEWAVEVWKWVYSIPIARNPLLDCEGRWANEAQPGRDVFFIAPVGGDSPPPCVRTFTVPANKYLLVPILIITVDNIDTVPPLALEQMYNALDAVTADPEDLYAYVDGVAVTNVRQHRATSAPFNFFFKDADNQPSTFYPHPITGLIDPIVVDGYWLLLEPLSVGHHTLHTGGRARGVPFLYPNEIVANITVIPTNRPPVADASATRSRAIATDAAFASARLDGSRSSDPDHDILSVPWSFFWMENGSMIAAGAVSTVQLQLGTHSISLIVNDGVFQATNSVAIRVITADQAIRELAETLEKAGIAKKHVQPLLQELRVVQQMVDRGRFREAAHLLKAFEKKVDRQVAANQPAIAASLKRDAAEIIQALEAASK